MILLDVPRAMNAHRAGSLTDYEGDPRWVMEPKLDGFRAMYVADEGRSEGYARSSKAQDFHTRVPHVMRALDAVAPWNYTVIDGELTSPDGVFHGFFTSCMKSLPPRCWRLQVEAGEYLEYHAFDLLWLDGRDQRGRPLVERRALLESLLGKLSPEHNAVRLAPQEPVTEEGYSRIVEAGLEGVMLKDLTAPYLSGRRTKHWLKRKGRKDTLDVVVMGFTDARYGKGGKFFGLIGSCVFGLYRDGELVRIGKCSGMVDEVRREMTRRRDELVGSVITIAHEGFQAKAVRFPQFKGFRDDKPADECTWDTL